GVVIEDIKFALESYQPSNSRSQLVETSTNKVILDAYNANPTSMDLAIKNIYSVPHSQKVLMLGSMKELGDESIAEHQKIIDTIHQLGFDDVFVVGPEFEATTLQGVKSFGTSLELKDYLLHHKIKDALV